MDMEMYTYRQSAKNYTKHGRWGRRLAVLACTLSALTLSACTEVDDVILKQSGIMPEEDYKKYIELRENGQLDLDGQYIAPEMASEPSPSPEPEGVHVTFATNAYIEIAYYFDAELSQPVDVKECYLKPGDCIYAAEPVCIHPVTDKYSFEGFHIYAYDESKEKSEELFWNEDAETPNMVLQVPDDYKGTEISVEPVGQYEDRTITLTDYYVTDHRQELEGTWIVDDGNRVETTEAKVVVSPVSVLAIDYQYDAEKFEYDSSEPAAFYHENGLVRFELAYPDQGIEQFEVKLRKLEGTFRFDPNDDYAPEHGKVEFSYNGKPITDVIDIEDGGYIHYKLKDPEEGYHINEKNGEGNIRVDASNQEKTKDDIKNAIAFKSDKLFTIYLPQPQIGGEIAYYDGGDRLLGGQCALTSQTVITMKFNHWNGWIVDANAAKEYIVREEDNQTVSFGGAELSKLFKESDEHKPVLNLVVKDSMKAAQFAVTASENGKNNLSYDNGSKTAFYQSDREVFGGEKVGTGSNIVLSVADDTIFNGQAMKLEIKTKDTKGNEEKILRYVTELPAEQTIKLYGAGQQMTSPTVYESVNITVSKVDVSTYNAKSVDHAKVIIRVVDDDEPHTLKDGEVLESSRKVEVTIKPEEGWYITGSKLLNGEYSDTMKYSDWEKDRQKILDKHTAQKLWYVTLDTSDSYGICVYKLDGIAVSGRVGIREGQKLKLEYTITNHDYEITRSGFTGMIGNAIHEETEKVDIKVTAELDEKTIKRSDYIAVAQKEG